MDICGEHGDDIAYSGRDCPACEQVDDLKREHSAEMSNLESDMQYDIDELQREIDEHECK